MYRQSEKNMLNSNISSTCRGELRSTSGWDRLVGLGHFSKFQWVSCLGFVTALTSLNGSQINFVWRLAVSLTGTLYVHLHPNRNYSRCTIHSVSKSCVLLYWQRYSTALEQCASVKLCGLVQGMELQTPRHFQHRVPHIFWGILRVAITLCIRPHSS